MLMSASNARLAAGYRSRGKRDGMRKKELRYSERREKLKTKQLTSPKKYLCTGTGYPKCGAA